MDVVGSNEAGVGIWNSAYKSGELYGLEDCSPESMLDLGERLFTQVRAITLIGPSLLLYKLSSHNLFSPLITAYLLLLYIYRMTYGRVSSTSTATVVQIITQTG